MNRFQAADCFGYRNKENFGVDLTTLLHSRFDSSFLLHSCRPIQTILICF